MLVAYLVEVMFTFVFVTLLDPDPVSEFVAEPMLSRPFTSSSLMRTFSIHCLYGRLLVNPALSSSSSIMRPCSKSIKNILPGCKRHLRTILLSGTGNTPDSDPMITMSSSVMQ